MAATTAVTAAQISVEEYLNSVYRPDMDYVDGTLEERNVGEFDHSAIQKAVLFALTAQERSAGVRAMQELRVRVSETSFRIPDVCLLPAGLRQQVVTVPPLLCVEVLSPRDTVKSIRRRSEEYLLMGVPEVLIFDPRTRTAYVFTNDHSIEYSSGTLQLQHSNVEVSVDAIFKALDD